mmetsp:Transcript_65979/g.169817  ORF Transcript_65979/g.169817 Transcript_65979/m.169817 type:complete len:89 (+) Transcript_65979:142-408(+)
MHTWRWRELGKLGPWHLLCDGVDCGRCTEYLEEGVLLCHIGRGRWHTSLGWGTRSPEGLRGIVSHGARITCTMIRETISFHGTRTLSP